MSNNGPPNIFNSIAERIISDNIIARAEQDRRSYIRYLMVSESFAVNETCLKIISERFPDYLPYAQKIILLK